VAASHSEAILGADVRHQQVHPTLLQNFVDLHQPPCQLFHSLGCAKSCPNRGRAATEYRRDSDGIDQRRRAGPVSNPTAGGRRPRRLVTATCCHPRLQRPSANPLKSDSSPRCLGKGSIGSLVDSQPPVNVGVGICESARVLSTNGFNGAPQLAQVLQQRHRAKRTALIGFAFPPDDDEELRGRRANA
jgi:hypothetical protein